jgi:hypothetical protein
MWIYQVELGTTWQGMLGHFIDQEWFQRLKGIHQVELGATCWDILSIECDSWGWKILWDFIEWYSVQPDWECLNILSSKWFPRMKVCMRIRQVWNTALPDWECWDILSIESDSRGWKFIWKSGTRRNLTGKIPVNLSSKYYSLRRKR